MRYKLYITGLILTMAFASCKKESLDVPGQNPEPQDTAKSFLKEVQSDPTSEFYISGEFDGHRIYCASTFANSFPYHDTTYNALFLNNSIDLDNIHLVRQNQDMSVLLAIYFDKAKIYSRQFPYILPRANLDTCEAASIELINMKKIGTTGQGAPDDDFSFWGRTDNSIKIQVNSLIDNIMQGTFEGSLKTKTGSIMQVRNGSFRIKIIVVN